MKILVKEELRCNLKKKINLKSGKNWLSPTPPKEKRTQNRKKSGPKKQMLVVFIPVCLSERLYWPIQF